MTHVDMRWDQRENIIIYYRWLEDTVCHEFSSEETYCCLLCAVSIVIVIYYFILLFILYIVIYVAAAQIYCHEQILTLF